MYTNFIAQMQRRDEEMEKGAEELRTLKEEIKITENQMAEKQLFLENEQENNHEKEKVVDIAERQVLTSLFMLTRYTLEHIILEYYNLY